MYTFTVVPATSLLSCIEEIWKTGSNKTQLNDFISFLSFFTDSEYAIKVRISLKAAMGDKAVSITNHCLKCYYLI